MAERHKHILTLESEWEQTARLTPERLLMNFHLHRCDARYIGQTGLHPMSQPSIVSIGEIFAPRWNLRKVGALLE